MYTYYVSIRKKKCGQKTNSMTHIAYTKILFFSMPWISLRAYCSYHSNYIGWWNLPKLGVAFTWPKRVQSRGKSVYSIYTGKHRTAGKQDFSVKVLMYIPFHEKAILLEWRIALLRLCWASLGYHIPFMWLERPCRSYFMLSMPFCGTFRQDLFNRANPFFSSINQSNCPCEFSRYEVRGWWSDWWYLPVYNLSHTYLAMLCDLFGLVKWPL